MTAPPLRDQRTGVSPETPIALARKAAEALAERGVENSRHDAETLLAHVLGIKRLDLYLQFDRPLTEAEVDRYREVVRRRRKREPLQYILGEVEFRELVLDIDQRVLIPRPETEVLVGAILDWASARASEADGANPLTGYPRSDLTVLDVGAGSGAIALSLAQEGPFSKIVATDISAGALTLLAENAQRTGVSERVEPRRGALWEPVAAGERFDVIVSNPPYIPEAERAKLPPEVREWEPAESLFAEDGGLRILAALIEGAPDHLKAGGILALEVGVGQAHDLAARMESTREFDQVEIIRDLTGRERIIRSVLRGGAQREE